MRVPEYLQPSPERYCSGVAGLGFSGSGVASVLGPVAMATPLAPIGLALTLLTDLNKIGSLVGLNSSDPARDRERINRINVAFKAAMEGNDAPITTGDPNSNLEGATGAQYLEYIATNNHGNPSAPGPGTAAGTGGAAVYGSQIAYRYAQTKWTEFQARHAAGQVGAVLVGQSDIPGQVGYALQRAVSSPVTLVLIAGAAYFLLRRKR